MNNILKINFKIFSCKAIPKRRYKAVDAVKNMIISKKPAAPLVQKKKKAHRVYIRNI